MKNQAIVLVRFKDRVLIPTMSRTTQGYSLAIDPVAVHDVSDDDGIVRSVLFAIALKTPIVPTPSRAAWPKSVLLAPAGVKSDAALEKSGATWTLGCDGTLWHIYPSKRNAKGRWETDMTKVETHPADIPPEQLARRMVELVKNTIVQD